MKIDPVVLFFVLGLTGGILKSDLELPKAFLEALTIFLLLALGLKGGVAIAKSSPATLILPAIALIVLALAITFLAFLILHYLGKLNRADAAATAAHYGSVSVITFVVAKTYLADIGVDFNDHMTFFLALLEVPALILAAIIGKQAGKQTNSTQSGSWGALIHEILFGKSVLLLIGGMLIGMIAGEAGTKPFAPLFFDLFKGVVCFLLMELGASTARQLPELRKSGVFLTAFGIAFPLLGAFLGALVAYFIGFSVGDQTLAAVLMASASYIAAPSAMRIALPESNLGLAIAPVVAITFPFNVIFGIPIYHQIAIFTRTLFGG